MNFALFFVEHETYNICHHARGRWVVHRADRGWIAGRWGDPSSHLGPFLTQGEAFAVAERGALMTTRVRQLTDVN